MLGSRLSPRTWLAVAFILAGTAGIASGQIPAITSNGSLGPYNFWDTFYTYYLNTDAMTIDVYTSFGGYAVGGVCPPGTYTGAGDVDGCARLVSQPGGPDIVVYDFTTLDISMTVNVVGSRPAALAATGAITISGSGLIRVASGGYAGSTTISAGAGTAGSGPGGGGGGKLAPGIRHDACQRQRRLRSTRWRRGRGWGRCVARGKGRRQPDTHRQVRSPPDGSRGHRGSWLSLGIRSCPRRQRRGVRWRSAHVGRTLYLRRCGRRERWWRPHHSHARQPHCVRTIQRPGWQAGIATTGAAAEGAAADSLRSRSGGTWQLAPRES